MAIGGTGKDDPKNAGKGKPGGGMGKAGAGRQGSGGLGSKQGSVGKSGGMGSSSNKQGMGGGKSGGGGFGAKPGASSSSTKPGMMGSKSGSSGGMMGKSTSSVGSKMGGMGGGKPPIGKSQTNGLGSKPGTVAGKPGAMGSKPGIGGAKPGAPGTKPGAPGTKPGAPGTKPGAMGAKPGAPGTKPGAPGTKPGAPGTKPGAPGTKPGAPGTKPGAMGAKPGVPTKPGAPGAKPGALGAKPGAAGAKPGAMGAVNGKMGIKSGAVAGKAMTARTAVALKTSHDVAKGMAPQKSGSSGGAGLEREGSVVRNASGVAAAEAGGQSRNIPLSQMDKLDITKMTPRELMMLERQYGAGWLKTLAPTQFNRLQSAGGAGALTSNTPSALSSHMDPSMLQAASGVTGNSGMMSGQISCVGSDQSVPLEVDVDQLRPLDASALAEHPEQIGGMYVEGEMEDYTDQDEEDGEEYEEGEEVQIPSDLMRARLIDDSLAAEETDGPNCQMSPQMSSPMATSSHMTTPMARQMSSSPRMTHPHMTSHATSHLTATPQTPLPPPTLLITQMSSCSAPPAEEYEDDEDEDEDEEEEEETTIHLTASPAIAPQISGGSPYFCSETSPYGENLYNQQPGYEPGYDPLDEQYRMSAPLLEKTDTNGPFPQYKEIHHSYYHFSQNSDPNKYSFTKAVDNYDNASRTDGTYCYSCVMFCGVLMIGAGIIMVIVELFGLFGKTKHMPMAIAGAGVLGLGIMVLAGAMLLWRRKRSNMKKLAVSV